MSTTVPTLGQRLTVALRALSTPSYPTDAQSFAGRLLGGIIQSGGALPERGTADYLKAYGKMPWLRAVAERISYDVAATEWRLYVARKGGQNVRNRMVQRAAAPQRELMMTQLKQAGEVVDVTEHPLLDLLAKANILQTGLDMRQVTQAHLDLVGDAFWLLEEDPVLNIPIGLWPVPPSWVLGTPTVTHPFYRMSYKGWQETIPAGKVIWFSDPNPSNPYGRGTGKAQALGDELETDEYTVKHLKSFYLNGARPDIVVWPKGEEGLKDGEVERLEEGWNARSGGFWRRFKPFFLKREVEIRELTQNFQTQQLTQIREFERNTILQVFGVSPEIIGILSTGSNRATITAARKIYKGNVQVPRLERLRSVMQERLVPLFDERLIINYIAPVVDDEEMELKAAEAAPHAPTVDEWRAKQGLPPMDDKEAGRLHIGNLKQGPMPGMNGLPLQVPTVEAKPPKEPKPEAVARPGLAKVAKDLFSAGEAEHKGLLVSLWLDPDAAAQLAVPGGEAAETLHVTLGYCGDVSKLGDVAVARALIAVDAVASASNPLHGKAHGSGQFAASPQSGDKTVFFAIPDVPRLAELRHMVASALRECGVPPREDHGWAPHITLKYGEPGDAPPAVPTVPLSFRAISVSVGASRTELALGHTTAEPVVSATYRPIELDILHEEVCRQAGDKIGAAQFAKVLQSNDDDPEPTRLADRYVDGYRKAQSAAWATLSDSASMEAVVAALNTGSEDRVLVAFGGEDNVGKALSLVLKTHATPAFLAGAELAIGSLPEKSKKQTINISLDAVNDQATAWARANAARLVRGLGADAKAAIRELIVMSNEQGIPIREVARMLKDDRMIGLLPRQAAALRKYRKRLIEEGLDAATIAKRTARYGEAQLRLRAMTIARTELVGAVNAGQQALWEQAVKQGLLPANTERVWLVTLDDALDLNICEPLTDAVAPMNQPFAGGYMQPPAHPRCRCAIGIRSVPR